MSFIANLALGALMLTVAVIVYDWGRIWLLARRHGYITADRQYKDPPWRWEKSYYGYKVWTWFVYQEDVPGDSRLARLPERQLVHRRLLLGDDVMSGALEDLMEWRWVDDQGRAMTNWKQGDAPLVLDLKDDKGEMHVEVRLAATPQQAPAVPSLDSVPRILAELLDEIPSHKDQTALEDAVFRAANRIQVAHARELNARQAFKDYVHQRLDAMGIPHSVPESEHDKAGCRVGGRLDYVEHRLSVQASHTRAVEIALVQFTKMLDEHPEGWDGPCACRLCMSYADVDEGEALKRNS